MGGQFFMSYDKGFQNKLPLADKYWYPNCCPICILGGVTQLQSTDSVPFLVRYHILVAWNLDEDGVKTLQPCTSPQNSSNWYELIRFMDIHGMFVKKTSITSALVPTNLWFCRLRCSIFSRCPRRRRRFQSLRRILEENPPGKNSMAQWPCPNGIDHLESTLWLCQNSYWKWPIL